MAACPGCQKFASLELQEPEPESDPEIDGESGIVTCEVRIVRNSACCGEEMKEATLELEADVSNELDVFIAAAQQAARDESEALAPDDLTEEAAAGREEALATKLEAVETDIREGLEVEADFTEVEETQDTYQKGPKKGQRIPNPRYWTTLFGAEMTGRVLYEGETVAEFTAKETVPASGMDELN